MSGRGFLGNFWLPDTNNASHLSLFLTCFFLFLPVIAGNTTIILLPGGVKLKDMKPKANILSNIQHAEII